MDFVTNIVPDPSGLGDRDAETAMTAFLNAVKKGDAAGLPPAQQEFANRISQANAKIASGVEIARTGELMTLAQFGAGSVGGAIADVLGDPNAGPAFENLMTARFLMETVLSGARHPQLFPADLLRKENVMREGIFWPVADGVYRDLLDRSVQALGQAAANRGAISAQPGRKLFDREHARNVRQARKLSGKDPDSRRARLNGLDRIIISLTILLHIRATP